MCQTFLVVIGKRVTFSTDITLLPLESMAEFFANNPSLLYCLSVNIRLSTQHTRAVSPTYSYHR